MEDNIIRYPVVMKYVGKLIYERGWEYFREDKILQFQADKNTITALVKGSGSQIYHITASILNDDVENSHCTCPYWARCKHIAAVLIYYFHNKTSLDNASSDNHNGIENNEPERIIPLSFNEKTRREVRFVLEQTIQPVALSKSQSSEEKQYKLIFKIKPKFQGYDSFRWFITPALKPIRKDGAAGSVHNYNPAKALIPYSRIEEKLLKRLLDNPEMTEPVENHLDAIIEHPEIELFLHYDYRSVSLSRSDITKIDIYFDFTSLAQRTPLFKPRIRFYYSSGSFESTSAHDLHIVKSGIYFAGIARKGLLLYSEEKGPVSEFIDKLFAIGTYTASDIIFVKELAKQAFGDKIRIVFDITSVKIISSNPSVVLELERKFLGAMEIKIAFKYGTIEVKYADTREHVFRSEDKEIVSVMMRNRLYEESMMKVLFDLLATSGLAIPINQALKSGEIFIEKDLNDFILDQGLILMESGYALRIGKTRMLSKKTGKLMLSMKSDIDWFDVQLKLKDTEGNEVDLSIDKDEAYKGVVKAGDSYILLDKSDIEKMRRLIEEGVGQAGKLKISKYNLQFIDEFYTAISNPHDDEIARLKKILENLKNGSMSQEYDIPVGFKGKLREYQKTGYSWLLSMRSYGLHGCLADDMGLGKTVQTLALLERLKGDGELGLSLLVVPVTTFVNWENEFTRFCSSLSFIPHAGTSRATTIEELKVADVIIVSYQTLRNDHALFSAVEFDYLILDESQNIKNASTKTYKVIHSIKSKHRLSLTGTPVENSTIELWALMEILNPGLLHSLDDFKKRFARPIQDSGDSIAAGQLRKIINPFILRRKKEDVLPELPEKEIINTFIDLGYLQRQAYDEVRDYYRERIKSEITVSGLNKSRFVVLEGLLRLRQMVLFPALVDEKFAKVESSKFELLKEMLDEILKEDHKILIYSQFVGVLKIIEQYFTENSYKYVYLDGSTKNRASVIETFQTRKDINIFLLSLKAGGIGINLTSADYVVLFDPWWNPAIEAQAIDRAHRIGQRKKVIAYKFIVKDTVEEKILMLQGKKQKMLNDIIAEDSAVFKHLDVKEIIELFS
jgi:superfamily II DNA or RNA helicase